MDLTLSLAKPPASEADVWVVSSGEGGGQEQGQHQRAVLVPLLGLWNEMLGLGMCLIPTPPKA